MRIKIFIFLFGIISGVALSGVVDKLFFPQVVYKQEVKKIKNSPGASVKMDNKILSEDTLTRKERRKKRKLDKLQK